MGRSNTLGCPMKTCFKCEKTKPLTEFYKHPQMADGRVNKCKECNKKDVRENRKNKVEYYREYDKRRGNRQTKEYRDWYRATYPRKCSARTAVGNAVRDGYLFPQPCEECGNVDNIHAHHDDYSKQLDVRWLCAACHKAWHMENGEGLNGD